MLCFLPSDGQGVDVHTRALPSFDLSFTVGFFLATGARQRGSVPPFFSLYVVTQNRP